MAKELSAHTTNLLALLNHEDYTPQHTHDLPSGHRWAYRYFGMPGQTRDRVVVQSAIMRGDGEPDWSREQRFVRCFVDRTTGDILYSAGWDGPAKWGTEWASEFSGDDHVAYAEFTRDRGWGYKGDRAAWESRLASQTDGE